MGTRMAPNYANLFMGDLEEEILDSYPLKPLVWYRYIDDIFLGVQRFANLANYIVML